MSNNAYTSQKNEGAKTKAPSSALERFEAYEKGLYTPKTKQSQPKQEEVLYTTKSGNKVTYSTLQNWANPRYNPGKEEIDEIKDFLNGTRRWNPKKSQWDLETAANVDALRPNISRQIPAVGAMSSFGTGLAEGMLPFLNTEKHDTKQAERDAKKAVRRGENYYYNNDEAQWVNRLTNENKLANIGGRLGGSMVLYKGMSSLPAVANISSGVTKALGGGKVASYLGNLVADTSVDLGVDTLPQLVEDITERKSGSEIAKNTAENIGANVAFNIGGDAISRLIGNAIDKKAASQLADTLKKVENKEPVEDMSEAIAKRISEEQSALTPDSLKNYQKEIDTARELQRSEALRGQRFAEEQSAQGESLSDLMKRFEDAENASRAVDTKGVAEQTTIPTLGENSALKTASKKSVKKTSDDALNKVLNDHFNMYGKNLGDVQSELNKALNDYEQTLSKEALDRVNALTAQAEKEMTGKVYNRQKDIGKRSGKTRPISYPGKWGTLTDNVNAFVNNVNRKASVLDSNSIVADEMKSLSDTLSKSNIDKNVMWEELSNVKQSLESFAKTGDEADVDKALVAITNLGKSSDVNLNELDRPFFEALEKAGNAYSNPVKNIADATAEVHPRNVADNLKAESIGLNNIPKLTEQPIDFKQSAESFTDNAKRTADSFTEGATKTSRYGGKTIPEKSDLPDDVLDSLRENPPLYEALKNADTSQKASDILANNDLNEALRIYRNLLNTKDPTSVPLGYDIAKQMIENGNTEGALDIIEGLSKELTKSGQFTQAAAIRMVQSEPMSALRLMERQIKKINDYGADKFKNWKKVKLTDDEVKAFGNIQKGDTEAINSLFDSITDRISKEMPSTLWEKITEAMKASMMFNPRTHIRNIAANTILMPIRSLTDRVSALGQNIAHLIDPNVKVTQSLFGGSREQKKIARGIFDEQILPLLKEDSKWQDVKEAVDRGKQVFRDNKLGSAIKNNTVENLKTLNTLTNGKLQNVVDRLDKSMTGSFMENLRRFDYFLLGEVEDNPFVKNNFVNRLASYMNAQGIKSAEDVPNDAIQTAYQEALKATFKDDNYLTKAFSGLKKDMGKFGEVVFPFIKTPANIAKRGLEYSPVGFIDTLFNSKGKTTDKIIDDLAKNAVGTAGVILGYKLAEKGLIQGALSSKKDEKQFEQQQGKKAFSIDINGKYYTFDWAQPASIPIVIGSTIHDAIEESDKENADYLDIAKQGVAASINAWTETSPLQTLRELLGGSYGRSFGENVIDATTAFPQRLIPSLGSSIAKTMDTTVRETRDASNPSMGVVNTIKSKIPGLSQTLPAQYDTWGNEKKRQDTTGDALIANFLNPGAFGYNASTPIDAEIERLAKSTESASAYPNVAENKVGDKKLTAKEHSDYQKSMGKRSYEMAEKFINSDVYRTMDDAQKAKRLSEIYSTAKALAENEMFGKEIPSTVKTYANLYRTGGADAVIDRIETQKKFTDRDLSTQSDKNMRIYEAKGDEGLDILSVLKSSYGKTTPKYAYEYFSTQTQIPTLEAGEYLYMLDEDSNGHTKGVQRAYESGGYQSVYDYFTIKRYADANGNGTIAKGEIKDYLRGLGMNEANINAWLEVFGK